MGAGKSSVLKLLKDDGFSVVSECARTILAAVPAGLTFL